MLRDSKEMRDVQMNLMSGKYYICMFGVSALLLLLLLLFLRQRRFPFLEYEWLQQQGKKWMHQQWSDCCLVQWT